MSTIRLFARLSLVAFLIFMLAACRDVTEIPPIPKIFLTQVTDQIATDIEIVKLDNCEGGAEITQTKERMVSVSIEGEATIGFEYKVLEANVTAKYAQIITNKVTQELKAAPRMNMEYTLDWNIRTIAGDITSPPRAGKANYSLLAPLAVNVTSKSIFCPSGIAVTQTPIPVIQQPIPPTSTLIELPAPTPLPSLVCLSYADLEALGNVLQPLYSPPGTLAGAQIAFRQNWTTPYGWVIQKNGVNVDSVSAGDIASVWSAEACRPLVRLATDVPITPTISRGVLDSLFGEGNWFCYPDRQTGVGVRRIPSNYLVKEPVTYIDNYSGRFYSGNRVAASGGGNGELNARLPREECPLRQQQALTKWDSNYMTQNFVYSRTNLNAILGAGNWNCLADYSFGVTVNSLSRNFKVEYPYTTVDFSDGQKYGVGEIVPGGGRGTIWLAGSVDRNECP